MISELIDKFRQGVAELRLAYVTQFKGPLGERVLLDLARFCRANETTFHDDPRVQAALEGRRQVWLHIQELTQLSPEQIFAIYRRNQGIAG